MAKDEAPAGAPMWMVTFADLMSLAGLLFRADHLLFRAGYREDQGGRRFDEQRLRLHHGRSTSPAWSSCEGNPQFKFARNLVPIPLDNVIGPIDEDGNDVAKLSKVLAGSEWKEVDDRAAR